jgi:hypothetical protein
VLETAGVRWAPIRGPWEQRFAMAVAAIEALGPPAS